uniref:Uncharacterized protein n=1 Tax=Panagrolaimus superbus TaxID=310955 RepID=A0A914XXW6_9BILA
MRFITFNVYDTTSSLKSEEYYDDREGRKTTSIPVVKLLDDDDSDSDEKDKDKTKKVFSSQEDLKETPPDFFYSSARFETTTYRSAIDDKSQTKSKSSSSNYWSPKPVNIDFVSNPINGGEPKPSEASSFTINPNQLLSTIFRIPEVFPTVSISPDPTTESVNVDFGSSVEILSPTSSEEDDDFFDDNETTWITKTVTPKNIKVAVENSTMPSFKKKILETNKTKPKSILSSTSKPVVTTTTPDKLLKSANQSEDKVVQLLGSYEVSNSSEVILDNSFFNETKEIFQKTVPDFILSKEKTEEEAAITPHPKVKEHQVTTVIPIKKKPDILYHNYRKFSSKENAKPYLSGTKIHIIPIQHYSKEEFQESLPEIAKSDKNDEENRDEIEKSNENTLSFSPQLEPFDISYPLNTAPTEIPVNPKPFDSTANYDNSEKEEIELFDTTSLKWIIIGYFILFITALGIIVYLLIAIITKKCKRRRKSYIISG